MGREAKILLAILGLLAGVFIGVLSMKLLVPRPPAGAGPDVHGDIAAAVPTEIVEPPSLMSARESPVRVSAREPAVRVPAREPVATEAQGPATASDGRFTARTSRFSSDAEDAAESPVAPVAARDPFLSRGAAAPPQPLPEDAVRDAVPLDPPADAVAVDVDSHRNVDMAFAEPPRQTAAPATYVAPRQPVAPSGAAVSAYVAVAGDSWWSLAEQAYGDGRLYRALFAWNRSRNPRVSLVPGTPLELPTRSQLATAWPALVPRE